MAFQCGIRTGEAERDVVVIVQAHNIGRSSVRAAQLEDARAARWTIKRATVDDEDVADMSIRETVDRRLRLVVTQPMPARGGVLPVPSMLPSPRAGDHASRTCRRCAQALEQN